MIREDAKTLARGLLEPRTRDEIISAIDTLLKLQKQQLFDLGNGLAVNCNPAGRFHGWLFQKHPDGHYVSVRQLKVIENES